LSLDGAFAPALLQPAFIQIDERQSTESGPSKKGHSGVSTKTTKQQVNKQTLKLNYIYK